MGYTCDEAGEVVHVNFFYSNKEFTKTSCIRQRATVQNVGLGTEWRISPQFGVYLPVSIPYLVVDCVEDYSSTIIGVPDRSYVWIMTRVPDPEAAVVEALTTKAQLLGFNVTKLQPITQYWPSGPPQ